MASDLTPEEIAGIRAIAEEAGPLEAVCAVFGDRERLFALLDMAERCADYDRRLSEVMPADFKDWHQNSRREWPEVAASTITNLRQREDWAHAQMARELLRAAKELLTTWPSTSEEANRLWAAIEAAERADIGKNLST